MSFGTLDEVAKAEETTKFNETLDSIRNTAEGQSLTMSQLLEVVTVQASFREEFGAKIDGLISFRVDEQELPVSEDLDAAVYRVKH